MNTVLSPIKPCKLNKTQQREFNASGINEIYQELNFLNVTKRNIEPLLRQGEFCHKGNFEKFYNSVLEKGGWANRDLDFFKPTNPRVRVGRKVKYETLRSVRLIKVHHPETVDVDKDLVYFVEGFKKAVAVAQATGCETFCFTGVTTGENLAAKMNSISGQKRIVLDNDSTLKSIEYAKRLVNSLEGGWKVSSFKGFKGVDDLLGAGVSFDQVAWVEKAKWCSNFACYESSSSYVFSSPKFHDVAVPESQKLVLLEAAKGTGKSWYFSAKAKEILKKGDKVFAITHRINLSKQLSSSLEIPYITNPAYTEGSCGLCIDSVLKISQEAAVGATFFIDELNQVLDHLHNSDTLKKKRQAVVRHLASLLLTATETGGRVFVADADLRKDSVHFIQGLANISESETFRILNTYQFKKGDVMLSHGVKIPKSPCNAPLDLVAFCEQSALEGKSFFLALSAQKDTSSWSTLVIEERLMRIGVNPELICRIDSQSVMDVNHKAYNAAVRINQLCETYPIIIASPSLNTGVDIQHKGFDFVACISSGVLDSDGVRQFISRVRDWKIPRYIFASPERIAAERPVIKNAEAFEVVELAHERTMLLADEEWYNEMHEEEKDRIIPVTKKYYMAGLYNERCEYYEHRDRISQGLENEGFTVMECPQGLPELDYNADELLESLKAVSSDLMDARRIEVAESESEKALTEDEMQALFKAETLSVEEQRQLSSAQIRKTLGVEPTPEVQAFVEDGGITRLKNFNLLEQEGFEIFKPLLERQQYWAAEKAGRSEVAHDFKKRSIPISRGCALREAGFSQLRGKPEGFTCQDAKAFIDDLKSQKEASILFPDLPKDVTIKNAIKSLRKLLKPFGLNTVKTSNWRGRTPVFEFVREHELFDTVPQKWRAEQKPQAADWEAFKADIALIKRGAALDQAKNLPPLSANYKYANLATRARTMPLPEQPGFSMVDQLNADVFKKWLADQSEVAVDIETYGIGKTGGLNHIRGHIRLIQFATDGKIWIAEQGTFDLISESLKTFLQNPAQRKIGHNFMFDLRFLRMRFGVLGRNCADTMLGSKCLLGDMGAAQITSHSLSAACGNFLGMPVDKTEQKSDWGDGLTEAQLAYAAKDAWATFVLYKRLQLLTKKPELLLLPFPENVSFKTWEIENDFLFAAQQMEDTGYEIDTDKLNLMKEKLFKTLEELGARWDCPCEPTKKSQLKKYLSEKYGQEIKSLNKAAAAKMGDFPEILLMQQIEAVQRLIGVVKNIEEQLAIQGRVKPVFKTLTGTGRTSSGATKIEGCLMNLQSLSARVNPVLKSFGLMPVKEVFKTQLIIDLPASHGRISAELGNDKNALKAYMDDSVDLHCGTAAAIAKAVFPDREDLTEAWIKANKKSGQLAKSLRDTAKNTYYGWLNGAGVATIKKQISANMQINASTEICKKALVGLQEVFKGTTDFAKEKIEEIDSNQFVINDKVCGFYEFGGTYLSWKLGVVGGDLKIPATKAFAGIWSRVESLLMKQACNRIATKFVKRPEWNSRLQNFIHDEINAEIGHPEAAAFAHKVVKEEFGKICYRTIVGFDPLEKCYPLDNWSDK